MESAVPGTRPRSALVQKLSLRMRDQRSGVRVRGALPLFPLINVAFTRSDIKVPNPCSPSTPCLWLFLYGGHVDSVAQASRSNARMARRHQVVVVLDRRRGGYHPRRRDAGDCGCRSRAANRGGLSDASEFLTSRLVRSNSAARSSRSFLRNSFSRRSNWIISLSTASRKRRVTLGLVECVQSSSSRLNSRRKVGYRIITEL